MDAGKKDIECRQNAKAVLWSTHQSYISCGCQASDRVVVADAKLPRFSRCSRILRGVWRVRDVGAMESYTPWCAYALSVGDDVFRMTRRLSWRMA